MQDLKIKVSYRTKGSKKILLKMPLFTFRGSVSYTTGAFSPWGPGSPEEHFQNVNLNNQIISWISPVPPTLKGWTFQQADTGGIGNATVKFTVNGRASRFVDLSPVPEFRFNVYGGPSLTIAQIRAGEYLGFDWTSTTNAVFNNVIIEHYLDNNFAYIPINKVGIVDIHCDDGQIDSVRVDFAFDFQIMCKGASLADSICEESCNASLSSPNTSDRQYCLTDELDFAFRGTTPAQLLAPITYLSNYLSKVGPDSRIDTRFSSYCSKYPNFYDLTTKGVSVKYGNLTDVDICGCGLDSRLYDDYFSGIAQRYSGLDALGLDHHCTFGRCASSVFKTVSMVSTNDKNRNDRCNQLTCINVATFNLDGTFDRSNINVTQTGECANLVDKDAPVTPSSNKGLFVVLGAIFLILLLILLIYLVSRGRKSSP